MAKIPLTISKNYCADWGVWQGVRELIQNAKDAEDDGHDMAVTHYPRTSRLEIVTANTYVDPGKLLILGLSDKTPGQKRGQFGEGFVLGCLALVRKGHTVTFANGDQSWRVSFETPGDDHPLAGNELLTFWSRKLVARESAFTVEVEDIPTEAWEIMRKHFLFLAPPRAQDTIKTRQGTVLLAPEHKGKVFSRGIFVRDFGDLECGYDMQDLQLDRDRRFVDEFTMHWQLGQIWQDVQATHPELAAERVYKMAKDNAPEARGVKYHADAKLLASVRRRFHAEHGEDAVPVATMGGAKDIEGAGGKPAMVSDIMRELLEKDGLTLESAKAALEGQVQSRFLPGDLTIVELSAATRLLRVVPDFVVVQFKGDRASCRPIDDGKILGVDRRLLGEPPRQLLKLAIEAEARRRKVEPVELLIEHVAAVDPDAMREREEAYWRAPSSAPAVAPSNDAPDEISF